MLRISQRLVFDVIWGRRHLRANNGGPEAPGAATTPKGETSMKPIQALACLAVAATLAAPASAQQPLRIPNIIEMSGAGATVGTNWKNGLEIAVDEINAQGGILGRKVEITVVDTQSNPGVARAAVQKALDADPVVLFGPIYSGSVKATMPLLQEAGVA